MSLRVFHAAASANCYEVGLLLAQLGTPSERLPVDILAAISGRRSYAGCCSSRPA